MPVSPAMAEDLAKQVGDLYRASEHALLEQLAQALAEGINSPGWAEVKLRSIGDLRAAVEEISTALQHDADGAIAAALTEAYGRGRQAAVAELGGLDIGRELQARRVLPNAPAVDRLAASMVRDTRPLYVRITRAVTDAYRSIISRASGGVLLGAQTRRQATQRALDEFAGRGVTGFVDSAGRSWSMASYAEMAVRSVTARAAIEGHIDALDEIGVGLVIVSAASLECSLCAPWQGEILSLNGASGPRTVMEPHATDRGILFGPRPMVPVHVVGSLVEARAAGLYHPNCKHTLSAYLPGVTTRPESPPQPKGATYEDTQQQRYLERQVRAWKRREAAAMDDKAKQKARASISAYQKRLRELTAEKGLPRRSHREQLLAGTP